MKIKKVLYLSDCILLMDRKCYGTTYWKQWIFLLSPMFTLSFGLRIAYVQKFLRLRQNIIHTLWISECFNGLFHTLDTPLPAYKAISVGQKENRPYIKPNQLLPILYILQLSEGDVMKPPQSYGNKVFPVIHRQYIYFFSSNENRETFMKNPIKYICQPKPKPTVPVKIAIVGPPKSGKTTGRASIIYRTKPYLITMYLSLLLLKNHKPLILLVFLLFLLGIDSFSSIL